MHTNNDIDPPRADALFARAVVALGIWRYIALPGLLAHVAATFALTCFALNCPHIGKAKIV